MFSWKFIAPRTFQPCTSSFFLAVTFAVGSFFPLSVFGEQILVADDFSLKGPGTRKEGGELNGLAPQTGEGTWISPFKAAASTQWLKFSSSGTLVRSANNSVESRISIKPEGDIVTIIAEMTPNEGPGWSGVAFTKDLSASWFDTGTLVAGRIQNNKFFMGNASNFDAVSGIISSFGWDKLYTLKLSVDRAGGKSRFEVFEGSTSVGDSGWQDGFRGEIGAAALSMRSANNKVVQTIEPYVDRVVIKTYSPK